MISEQAKQGVNRLFANASKANLAMSVSDTIEVEQLSERLVIEPPEDHIVVLTVASYVFRLLIIFHVNTDKDTAAYFTKSSPGLSLEEAFGEIGNLCCGAMNRDLGKHFMHMGMSTPHMLESKAFRFLADLKPGYVSQFKIQINNTLSMHATLGLCAYAPIDFRVDKEAALEATGELELF